MDLKGALSSKSKLYQCPFTPAALDSWVQWMTLPTPGRHKAKHGRGIASAHFQLDIPHLFLGLIFIFGGQQF